MINDNYIIFPHEGGSATIYYKLSCLSTIGIANKQQLENKWGNLTIHDPESTQKPDGSIEGYVVIDVTEETTGQGHTEEPIIFYIGSTTQVCEVDEKEFHISQEGIGCTCRQLQISNVIASIPPNGLVSSSTIANYSILNNCPEESYTVTLINKNDDEEEYAVSLNRNNAIVLGETIPPIGLGGNVKTFELKPYFNNSEECGAYIITQSAEICDCEHADKMVKMFKRTFKNDGTFGREFLIGSGETACGYLIADCCSDMLAGGEISRCENPSEETGNIRTEFLDKDEETGRYKFNFWANVRYNTGATRGAGVYFTIVDEEGHEIAKNCDIGYTITQSTNACECSKTIPVEVDGENEWSKIELNDGTYCVRYDNGNTVIHFVITNTYLTMCKVFYVDYDEELFETRSPQGHKHWWNGTDHSFYVYLKPSVTLTENTEFIFNITEYVDAKVTDEKLDYGYPCKTTEFKVLIFTECTCEIENGAEYDYSSSVIDRDISVGSSRGEVEVKEILYCAESARMEIEFKEGIEDWATIVKGDDDKWIISYSYNLGKERKADINIIPIIDGVECESRNSYRLIQDEAYKYCEDCADVINDIVENGTDLEYHGSCKAGAEYIENVKPFIYTGKCDGFIEMSAINSSTQTPIEYVTYDYVYHSLTIKNNRTDSDWKFTIRATFSTVNNDQSCYKDAEITVKPCNNECDCYIGETIFHVKYYYENGCCFQSESSERTIIIGEVGDIADGDECLKYVGTVTEGDCEINIVNNNIIATIKPVLTTVYVNIFVNLIKTDGSGTFVRECDKKSFDFYIRQDCD